jgi:hypothetical protein
MTPQSIETITPWSLAADGASLLAAGSRAFMAALTMGRTRRA